LLIHEVIGLSHQDGESEAGDGEEVLYELGRVDGQDGEGGGVVDEVGELEGEGGEEEIGEEGGAEGGEEDAREGLQLDLQF